jgi:hypothetical protein
MDYLVSSLKRDVMTCAIAVPPALPAVELQASMSREDAASKICSKNLYAVAKPAHDVGGWEVFWK